ncbi:hypothetical protein GCM10010988_28860 [Cnuibacter physcomitrellae]|uniref:Uncharacterized protein n=1 Tax=Cnuibacter physcomitrellae TaxID=1619308 RepID=A0A1X9LM25_9MICO|nr:SdrD B-like domain-containing protein [Cnuibacter physcomitrellae]ARJ04159.1 hypothetical protein B5808_02145 [Cnuibacter physcomitrellae]GGI40394.1 hypothetical protein GCM10010988_28860 [Cnuibacter physcomitrellae]
MATIVAAVLTPLLAISTILVGGTAAHAALQNAQLTVVTDGTGPYDSLDDGPNNGVVRTHDTIGYGWQYNTDATATDVTFVQTITAPASGVTFDQSNLALCTGPNGGSISADGKTITCQRSLPANSTGAIPISVTVDGTNPNGTQIVTDLTADSAPSGTATTTIVAAPNFDLKKNIYSFSGALQRDGVWGRYIAYSWGVTAPSSLKGSENIAGPVTFIDDVSGVSPHAQLQDCPPVSATLEGYPLPYSVIGITSTSNANNSVINTGNQSCSQPGGPGTPITITLTNPDWSANTLPTATAAGSPIASGTNWVATGVFFLFVPVDDIVAAGGSLNTTNQFRGFDPVSISGQSNFGTGYEPGGDPTEPACPFVGDNSTRANNNCHSTTVIANQGGADKYLLNADATGYAGNPSGPHAGNGVVDAGTNYQSQLVMANFGVSDFTNQGVCDVWDPSTQQITAAGDVLRNATELQTAGTDYTVEFAALPLTSEDERRAADCGSGTWYSSIAAAGGPSVVNAIRFKANWTLTPNEQDLFRVKFVAMPNPSGTIIGDWAMTNFGGGWSQSSYSKESNSGGLGDRVILTPAIATITKSTAPATNSVLAGSPVTYQLNPALTSGAQTPAPVTNATVTDQLPSCLQYVAGSSSVPVMVAPGNDGADGIPCTGDAGETGSTLTINLGTRTPNQVIDPITYQVGTLGTTADGTHAPNTAVVSFDGVQPDDLGRRTAAYDIVIRNVAQFSIAKSTDTPLVQVRDSFRYTVSYRNNTGQAVQQAQLIDELPYNGDSRGTSYTGAVAFAGASNVPANAVVECTTDPHRSINGDPAANTNTWSPVCPPNTTGVRITVAGIPDGAVGGVILNFTATGNSEGDHYINTVAGARVTGLSNPITETAPVRVDVIASTIGDRVWLDSNYDGIQDPSEPGVGDVTVTLTGTEDNGTAVSLTTTTAADGSYRFTNLRAGSYTVGFIAPNGLEFTRQATGTGSDDSRPPIGLATQTAPTITLGVDSDNLDQDAGLARPSIELVKSASAPATGDTYTVGETVTYTFTVTNTGPTPLTAVTLQEDSFTNGAGTPLTLTTPITASNPNPFDGDLAPGGVAVYTATYVITQDDVDAGGSISNAASVTGLSPARQTVTDDSPVQISTGTPAPGISLVKGVSNAPANGIGFAAGETVDFTFTIRNTGNVTLRDVTLTEDSFTNATGTALKLTTGPTAPTGFTGTLTPGQQVVFTGTYVLTAADTTEDLDNHASVTGTPPTGGKVTDTSSVKVPTWAPPAPPAPAVPTSSNLASTGLAAGGIGLTAALLLAAGIVLILRRRRRRTASE